MIGLVCMINVLNIGSSVSRLPAAVPLRTRSSPGAPHRGGGLPASEPGLNAGTHDLLPTVTPARGMSARPGPRLGHGTAVARRPTGGHRLASGDGGLLRSRTKVESASAKPRLAGRQPPPWWGAPGDDLARSGMAAGKRGSTHGGQHDLPDAGEPGVPPSHRPAAHGQRGLSPPRLSQSVSGSRA